MIKKVNTSIANVHSVINVFWFRDVNMIVHNTRTHSATFNARAKCAKINTFLETVYLLNIMLPYLRLKAGLLIGGKVVDIFSLSTSI